MHVLERSKACYQLRMHCTGWTIIMLHIKHRLDHRREGWEQLSGGAASCDTSRCFTADPLCEDSTLLQLAQSVNYAPKAVSAIA